MSLRFLSPTSINTYLRCPRKFFLKYVKGLKEKPSIHLIRGKAVHESLARFQQNPPHEAASFEVSEGMLLSLFDRSWQGQRDDLEALRLPSTVLDAYYRESTEMLTHWLERHLASAAKLTERPRTEVKLFSQKHRVMGIIDLVHRENGQVFLTDYKTSKKDELTEEIKVQTAIYALLYQDNFGVLPEAVIIDFLKLEAQPRFRVTEDFVQYAAQLCRDVHEKIVSVNEEDYPCKCGGWCEKDFV